MLTMIQEIRKKGRNLSPSIVTADSIARPSDPSVRKLSAQNTAWSDVSRRGKRRGKQGRRVIFAPMNPAPELSPEWPLPFIGTEKVTLMSEYHSERKKYAIVTGTKRSRRSERYEMASFFFPMNWSGMRPMKRKRATWKPKMISRDDVRRRGASGVRTVDQTCLERGGSTPLVREDRTEVDHEEGERGRERAELARVEIGEGCGSGSGQRRGHSVLGCREEWRSEQDGEEGEEVLEDHYDRSVRPSRQADAPWKKRALVITTLMAPRPSYIVTPPATACCQAAVAFELITTAAQAASLTIPFSISPIVMSPPVEEALRGSTILNVKWTDCCIDATSACTTPGPTSGEPVATESKS